MILGIMQPYFFPHLGYFDLINYTDKWIVFDKVKYIRHGWVNRNRILHPNTGWQYVTVPVAKHASRTPISGIEIWEDGKWRDRILGQLAHYKKHAPHYQSTIEFVAHCLAYETPSLSKLNVAILEKVCELLGTDFNYQYWSEMDLEIGEIRGAGDWALKISSALGANEYVNPPGGEDIFDKEAFEARNILLTIRDMAPLEYRCAGYGYIPRLSIIDVLMWNSVSEVRNYLDSHCAEC